MAGDTRRAARRCFNRVACAFGFAVWVCSVAAVELSPLEQDGQRIYLRGESPSGARITARLGLGGLELAGASVACGNCHGEDGRGRSEGGVQPSDIRWSELTKAHGHQHAYGRRHGPFDEQHLWRALMQGEDPDGNALDPAMPRFSMSAKDLHALSAYLKKLESMLDPGLETDTIRIGTLLPQNGPLAPLGESLRAMWVGYFAALNQRGGIHGRRLELVPQALPADPALAATQLQAFLADGRIFALLAPLSAGIEAELSAAAKAAQVPVIGPLTVWPEDVRASNPQVFHLLPGVTELALALARHAARQVGAPGRPIAVWHPDTPFGRATAQSVKARLQEAGWAASVSVPFLAPGASHDGLAAALRQREVAAVLVAGAGAELTALASSATRLGWNPQLLVPGPIAPRDLFVLPAAFQTKVTLAYPTSPYDQRSEAVRDYTALLPAGTPRANQAPPMAAYAAGLLLTEALKRTGRDLSRRKLLATLEAVQGFETGLVPPLSYNADRRIGAMGAYLLELDLEGKDLRPLQGYVALP